MIKLFRKFFTKEEKEVKQFEASMANVERFNEWFCEPNNGATYAHKGIFLRTSKLGVGQIKEFFQIVHGVENVDSQICYNFHDEVAKDWRKKLSEQ